MLTDRQVKAAKPEAKPYKMGDSHGLYLLASPTGGMERLNIRPIIDATFPLEDMAEAFRYQQAGKHFGKVCLDLAG